MKSGEPDTWVTLSECDVSNSSGPIDTPPPVRRRALTEPRYTPLHDATSYGSTGETFESSWKHNCSHEITIKTCAIPVKFVGKTLASFNVVCRLNGRLKLESKTVLGMVDLGACVLYVIMCSWWLKWHDKVFKLFSECCILYGQVILRVKNNFHEHWFCLVATWLFRDQTAQHNSNVNAHNY